VDDNDGSRVVRSDDSRVDDSRVNGSDGSRVDGSDRAELNPIDGYQHRLSSALGLTGFCPIDGNMMSGGFTPEVLDCADARIDSSTHSTNDDDINDVKWELSSNNDDYDVDAGGAEIESSKAVVQIDNDYMDIDCQSEHRQSPEQVGIQSKGSSRQLMSASPPISPPTQPSGGYEVSPDIIDRALATASNMADWAGWAVRQALKNHSGASLHGSSNEASSGLAASQDGHGGIYPTGRTSNISSHVDDDRPSVVLLTSPSSTAAHITSRKDPSSAVPVGSSRKDPPVVSDAQGKIRHDEHKQRITTSPASDVLTVDAYFREPEHRLSSSPTAPHDSFAPPPPPPLSYQTLFESEVQEEVHARKQYSSAMRDTETMTQEMREQVIGLLQAFSIPYLVAPYEAEAQCAVLEQVGEHAGGRVCTVLYNVRFALSM